MNDSLIAIAFIFSLICFASLIVFFKIKSDKGEKMIYSYVLLLLCFLGSILLVVNTYLDIHDLILAQTKVSINYYVHIGGRLVIIWILIKHITGIIKRLRSKEKQQ